MKNLKYLIGGLLLAFSFGACSDDNETTIEVNPTNSGSFVDERDGYTYHWVEINGVQWTIENAHYDTGDETNCKPYSSDERSIEKYGLLYTYSGAQEAVPEGWSLPSDQDWKELEMALGMSAEEADQTGWRGSVTGELMKQSGEGTQLAMQMAGYVMPYTTMGTDETRYMSVCGFFWSATADKNKSGSYFYRKLIYNSGQVYRESMEPEMNMLSVRFVRDNRLYTK